MPTRTVITISVPPETAKAYRELAKRKKESASQLFREMFDTYKRRELEAEFRKIQRYAKRTPGKLKLTEKDIERMVFEGR